MSNPLQIFLSFENPRFPNLISAKTAYHLLDDLRHGGGFTVAQGRGVYGGKAEVCLRIAFADDASPALVQSLQFIILKLAEWAGQESILFVRPVNGSDLLPTSAGANQNLTVGRFYHVINQTLSDPLIWREVTTDKREVGDHTFIDGKIFTLTPE